MTLTGYKDSTACERPCASVPGLWEGSVSGSISIAVSLCPCPRVGDSMLLFLAAKIA